MFRNGARIASPTPSSRWGDARKTKGAPPASPLCGLVPHASNSSRDTVSLVAICVVDLVARGGMIRTALPPASLIAHACLSHVPADHRRIPFYDCATRPTDFGLECTMFDEACHRVHVSVHLGYSSSHANGRDTVCDSHGSERGHLQSTPTCLVPVVGVGSAS